MGKMITDPFAALGYGYSKLCYAMSEDDALEGCNSCPFRKLVVVDNFGARYACAFAHIQKLFTPEQLENFSDGVAVARE